jgi:hypothetical protein
MSFGTNRANPEPNFKSAFTRRPRVAPASRSTVETSSKAARTFLWTTGFLAVSYFATLVALPILEKRLEEKWNRSMSLQPTVEAQIKEPKY